MTARSPLLPPPRWSNEQLERDRLRAIEIFRQQRLEEPAETYGEAFERCRDAFDELMEKTVDLTQIRDHAIEIISTPRLRDALRYLAGPPISADDLKTLADAPSFARKRLETDPEIAERIVETVLSVLDKRRFPWVADGREPDESERERQAAVLASAAMNAMRNAETARRSTGKTEQEQQVEDGLSARGFKKVPTRAVHTLADAPAAGEFCRESTVVGRKADFIIGLFDRRVMPLECKVSNSAVNSIKRLNNDAARKAEVWSHDLGPANVVAAAVLSGVYYHHSLLDAQMRGLTLFWAHSLDSQLLDWIERTRPS